MTFVSKNWLLPGGSTPIRVQFPPASFRQTESPVSSAAWTVQASTITVGPDAMTDSPVGAAGRGGGVTTASLLQSEATVFVARTR